MHMADALLSPAIGGTFWAASAGLVAYSAAKLRKTMDDTKIPLMGVLGAFIFAAQMINFTIPATGSSGHLGGGIILAVLLGPYAAFLTMVSILTVQALFFADGGLLALGCNIFNMGFLPCFICYPLLFKPITGNKPTPLRLCIGISLAAIIGLQLGASSVVLETMASGISELPASTFALLMLPIHLGIGIVEGLVSTAVILFIFKERPELVMPAIQPQVQYKSIKVLLTCLLAVTLFTGSVLSSFASQNPDGLEWSIAQVIGQEELSTSSEIQTVAAKIQSFTSLLPDYKFKDTEASSSEKEKTAWPAIDIGTSLSGIVGSLLTLLLAVLFAKGIKLAVRH